MNLRPHRPMKGVGLVKSGLLLALAAFFSACSDTGKIVVYHTNDVHGWFWARPGPGNNPKETGGFPALKKLVDAEKKPHLLLDAGDWFMGTPEGGINKGEGAVELMNLVGYDAAAPGNHDFDFGRANLERLIKVARFPVLCANIYDSKTNARIAPPYVIKEAGGFKIGIFGLASEDFKKITFAENMPRLKISDPVSEARAMVAELRNKGADVIIALTHLGLNPAGATGREDDRALAEAVPGINLIVGGHSHRALEQPVKAGGAYIVQAGSKLTAAGRMEISLNNITRKITGVSFSLVPLDKAVCGEDAGILKRVNSLRKEVSGQLDRAVGAAPAPLLRAGGESLLGDWVADCMKKFARTDTALLNSGALRADIPAGEITLRTLYEVMPFDDNIMRLKLRGADLRAALEHGISSGYGRLQISGVTVFYAHDPGDGAKIKEILVGGNPLNDRKVYSVAAPDFLLAGGDGYDSLANAVEFVNTGRYIRDVMKWCVGSRRVLMQPEQGRWLEAEGGRQKTEDREQKR